MVYATILKTGAFLTALLAIAVIGLSSWTLSSTFTKEVAADNELENTTDSYTDNEYNETEFNPLHLDEILELFPSSTTPLANNTTIGESPKSDMEIFWENKPQRFKTLIQAFSAVSIFAGLIQLTLSWMVICGNMKNIRERVKFWQLANFIIFLLLMVCITVPLTFSVKKDAFLGSQTFWKQTFNKLKNEGLKYIRELDYKIFTKNLDGYFLTLIVNEAFLFTILSFTCCCLCHCCSQNAYRNV